MPMNKIEANRILDTLAVESKSILGNKSLSNGQKMSLLNDLEVKQKDARSALDIHARAGMLMVGGNALGNGSATFTGRAAKGAATPSIRMSAAEQEGMYMAAKSGQNLTIGLKDVANSEAARSDLPPQYIGLVALPFEPTRILDHIPSTSTSAPSIEFISHLSNTPGIGAPVVTLGAAASGGTFTAGTYFWKVTATNSGSETVGSNELTATLTSDQKQPLNWTAITGADGYRIYRGIAAGAENVLVGVVSSGATVTYADLGAAGTAATVPTVDRTSGARNVAPGGQMPEVSLVPTKTILTVRKIGIFTTLSDEVMADFETFSNYTDIELQRQITDRENGQLLNGDGTGENLLGILNQTGTLSRAKGEGDAALDVISAGIADLRTGPSYCEPDAIIINPDTWNAIRTIKNSLGNYILGDPGQTTVSDVWGVPVLQTTQIIPGTIVMGNLELATQAFIREGITLNMTNSSDDDFTNGRVKIRAEERLTFGVARPTAINILTGF